MESSVLVTIISVVGAGLIAVLGYFMKRLVDGIEAKIDGLETRINARIDDLEKRINARIDDLEKRINARIDDLEKRIDRLEAKVDRLEEGLNELNVRVAEIASTQQEHSAKLEHMMNHGERISALEGAAFGVGAQTPTPG